MYLKTSDKAIVNNYPYGSLKATVTFSIEFDKKKGFRSVFQSVNPKNGRINAPKKSTYSDIVIMEDNNGFITNKHISLNGQDEINKGCKFIAENFDLFTPEQIEYLYLLVISMLKVTSIAVVQYRGANFDDVKPIIAIPLNAAVNGLKEKINNFHNIVIDTVALDKTEIPNYQPFKVTSY